MSIGKKLGLAFGKTLIVLSFAVFAVGFLFLNTLSKPDKIKFWLSESDLYPAIAESIQDQFLSEGSVIDQIPSEIIKQAITNTFSAETAQGFFESSIDTSYSWLNGRQEELAIELDTAMLQQQFADNVSAGLIERFQSLPACPPRTLPSANLLELQCVPAGIDLTQVASTITEQIRNQTGDDGFGDGTITISPQNSENPDENLATQLKPAKDIYGILGNLPYISAGLFLIGAAIVLALSDPKYRALRTLAVASIPYGILYIISGVLLPKLVTASTRSAIETIEQPLLKQPLERLVDIIGKDIGQVFINLGAILVVVGVALLGTYIFMRKKDPKAETKKPKDTEHKPDIHHPETPKKDEK